MFKYSIVVEVSPDTSFKSMEELVEAIKLWRGVRNVELQNASQQPRVPDGALVVRDSSGVVTCSVCGTGLGVE